MSSLIRLIADGTLVPIVLIGVYALVFRVPAGHRYEAYCRILMAGLTSLLLAKYMSTLYQPTNLRPFELMGVSAGASYLPNPGFPSDHALFAAAITYAVWFETRDKLWSLILAGLVVLVCVGRVLALVHTPLDIAGGLAAASFGAIWYLTPRATQALSKHHKRSA
ncbi:MAG TPA: phosphatase PAP2 family protein [Candidatus Bathyarchaeia archaeon]|nr:phosphatase PAP2 family protein [Candidatus Bathyarchaeia archaeon]